jgi:hypothetical protein
MRYEICSYQYGLDAHGNHSPLEGGDFDTVTAVQTGFNVYVREYKSDDPDEDTWDEVYDMDFRNEDEREAAIAALLVLYPDADIDIY